MTTLVAAMDAIAVALGTIDGLQVHDVSPGQVTPPAAIVGVPVIASYHRTFGRALVEVAPTVMVLTSAKTDRPGQRLLAEFASPTGARSIRAAVEADLTLGGVVESCHVVAFRPLGLEEVGAMNGYFGGLFDLSLSMRT